MDRLLFSSAFATLMALSALPGAAAPDPPTRAVFSASIIGSVWRDGNVPVPGARVRLRNYATGTLEDATQANDLGRFAFRGLEGGHYVLEVVNAAGKLLAIGQPLAVGSGETVATFVRLGAGVPRFAGFFQNVAAASVATASAVGLTVLAAQDGCAAGQCCR